MAKRVSRASVQVGPSTLEMWPFDVPTEPPPGGAILQVEVCGMCGTDVTPFHADLGMQSTGTRRR